METVGVNTLQPGERFAEDLYHSSGRLVLAAGQSLGAMLVAALRRARVEELLSCPASETSEIAGRLRKIETPVSDLRVGRPLESSLYDADGELLLASGQILLQHHLGLFEKKGLTTVFRLPEGPFEEMARVAAELDSLAERALSGEEGGAVLLEITTSPSGAPRGEGWHSPEPGERPRSAAGSALIDRMAVLTEVADILRDARPGGRPGESPVDAARAVRAAGSLLDALAADAPLAIAAAHLDSEMELPGVAAGPYIVDHSANVATLSMAAAERLGYSRAQLLELGSAALLHDLGMLFTPAWIANKHAALTVEETLEVRRHARYGYAALLGPWGFSISVPVAALMCHERPGGDGYPDGRSCEAIHPFARLIAAADVYDAVGHPRPHRGGALPPEPAETVAHMARSGLLDREAVKALLSVTTSFPPGTVVELTSGEFARVVKVGDPEPGSQTLSVIRTAGGGPPSEMRLVSPSRDLLIVRTVPPEEFPVHLGEGF